MTTLSPPADGSLRARLPGPQAPAGALPDALAELLRRCHRAELIALATRLGVPHEGQRLDVLARKVGRALRGRGGHPVANTLLRRGDGPPWASVLAGLARHLHLPPVSNPDACEEQIVQHWLRTRWEALSDQDRAAVWGRPPPVPADPTALTLRGDLGRSFPYLAAFAASRIAMLTPAAPLVGCIGALWLTRPDPDALLPLVAEVQHLRQASRHRVVIGVVGSPSSGKDAAIRALFGIDTGNIDPVAGSTTEVAITRLEGPSALYVVNTPGLGDVLEHVTERAREVLDLIDVYVYVVNAQGGVQEREQQDHARCAARGRPVLVALNKVDTLRPGETERLLEHTRALLPGTALAVAFDPLPELAPSPMGVDAVRSWLSERLGELGKDPTELPW